MRNWLPNQPATRFVRTCALASLVIALSGGVRSGLTRARISSGPSLHGAIAQYQKEIEQIDQRSQDLEWLKLCLQSDVACGIDPPIIVQQMDSSRTLKEYRDECSNLRAAEIDARSRFPAGHPTLRRFAVVIDQCEQQLRDYEEELRQNLIRSDLVDINSMVAANESRRGELVVFIAKCQRMIKEGKSTLWD